MPFFFSPLFFLYVCNPLICLRHFLQGINLNQGDYDGRTALHVAAAEGQAECVKFLLETARIQPQPKDR